MMGKAHEFALYWAETGLAQKALNEKKTLATFTNGGTLKKENGLEVEALISAMCADNNLHVVYRKLPGTYSKGDEWILAGDDMGVNVDYNAKNRSVSVNCYGVDEGKVRALQAFVRTKLTRKVTRGRVYVVVQGDSGPYLHEMGSAGETFEPGNYHEAVVKEYRHVVEDLNNDDPCGRIIILDGPPGTGKTHCVRALLNEVPKGTFVLVPSNMLSNLGSPSFIKAMLREQKKGYPMIIVIEDADEAIASRDRANLSEISALLNFSDGIFGAMMDLRIVCTTNADVKDLDAAVMRHGRLCRRIEVGKLDHVQADAVYKRLGGTKEGLWTRGNLYALGEVYYAAKGGGSALGVPKKAKGRLGFLPEAEESPDPIETPAAGFGLNPGDVVTTDQGDIVTVREDGQLEMVRQGPIGSPFEMDDLFDDEEETFDDDDDLIDEDP
jgi:hypothetical protein